MDRPTLSSIPENLEQTEDVAPQKWVPKKKHEVLKAKYKCLKKLFKLYDASVLGMLPDYAGQGDGLQETGNTRRKRSNKAKTDACAGTSEVSLNQADSSPLNPKSMTELPDQNDSLRDVKYASTQDSSSNVSRASERDCGYAQTINFQPSRRKKPTRFQMFLQRIFGLRREGVISYCLDGDHEYALSDNNLNNFCRGREKRRRKGLRFRRTRRLMKIQSEVALREVGSPAILSCVQSVQKNCLCDTTARQCPIMGCKMMFNGIINYNDHLNLCHFNERKHMCNYCHEGFEKDVDKFVHESEHIGIPKLNSNLTSSLVQQPQKPEVVTQIELEQKGTVQEDKLNKIISFFERIANSDHIVVETKRSRYSDSNITKTSKATEGTESSSEVSGKTYSKNNEEKCLGGSDSTLQCPKQTPLKCHVCGERFRFGRQLNLHVDLEHRVRDKFTKLHSCAGIVNRRKTLDYTSEDGQLNVESVSLNDSLSTLGSQSSVTKKFEKSRSFDTQPSSVQEFYDTRKKSESSTTFSNKVCGVTRKKSESSTTISDQVSSKSTLGRWKGCSMTKLRSRVHYKWEPGTQIIHV